MSTFEVKVVQIDKVEAHPNADSLDLAYVGDFQVIARKGQYNAGDLAVYLPESSELPDSVLEALNMKGNTMLAGTNHNRIKAIKLRGIVSQGILYPNNGWALNQDVGEILGVKKWVAAVPVSLRGNLDNLGTRYTLKFDIENVKKYPSVLNDGEIVDVTEKCHGTFCCVGTHPDVGRFAFSKGLGAQGHIYKNTPENDNNLYVRTMRELPEIAMGGPFYVLGEVFGPVQDLKYGSPNKPLFRVFDVFVGEPSSGRYLNGDELDDFCSKNGLSRVPLLYRGPYSKQKMLELTEGKETISGKQLHVREGVVVKPTIERTDRHIGRVILKSINPAYLLRKGDVTEYE